MKHKLITLNRNITKIPIISITNSSPSLVKGENGTLTPQTVNFDGTSTQVEPSGYLFTVKDRRLFSSFQGTGIGSANTTQQSPYSSAVAVSETVIGTEVSFTAISTDTLFGVNNKLITTLTIEGRDTGARATVAITINKNISVESQYQVGAIGVEARQ